MLRAAVYARYSTERQKTTSVEDQIALCREAARRFECVVFTDHIYADSELSGTTNHRPGYQQLLKAAKERLVDAVIVESQDRLWRDQGEMHHALKRLAYWGVRVFSISTGSDLTEKNGKLMASILGWKDEIFTEDLKEKTRRGMIGQIKRGMAAGGRAYGYRSEPVYDASQETVGYAKVIDPDEADVVRRIFTLYSKGKGPKSIARLLNSERVPPPRLAKGRRPLGWTPATINGSPKRTLGILHNPLYIGQIVWNRSQKVRDPDTGKRRMRPRPAGEWITIPAPSLRIVPDELWEAVQHRTRALQRRSDTSHSRPKYLFSGLLTCAECGSNYVIKSGAYYGCGANINRGPEICQNSKQVLRTRIEQTLLQAIYDEVFSPETVAYVTKKVNESLARKSPFSGSQQKKDESALSQARQRLEHIKEAIAQGIITPTTKAMLQETEERVAELEAALQTPTKPPAAALPETVERHLRELKQVLNRDNARARAILATLIGEVILRRHGDRMVAELRGNLQGILDLSCDSSGAGRGILPLSLRPRTARLVA